MSLFRKAAMEALKTPEKLNEPSRLIKPAYWFLLLGLSSFCSYVILWSIFGRIPVRITGSGVIHHPSNRVSIHSEINGRLVQYFDGNNKCFQKGQAIARIDPYELRLKKRTLQKEINHLKETSPEKINKIAIEISSDILKKLIGADVNNSSISAIVNDLLKRNGNKYYGN